MGQIFLKVSVPDPWRFYTYIGIRNLCIVCTDPDPAFFFSGLQDAKKKVFLHIIYCTVGKFTPIFKETSY